MSTGLYPNLELVERFLGSVSATTLTQRFIAPCDLDILGMALYVSTAPGATDGVIVNVSNSPTSQLPATAPSGAANQSVAAYNLWTSANAPSILGTATNNLTVTNTGVIENVPYALNYPLPGPSGTTGFKTAQSTSQTTETPVTAPPTIYEYGIAPLVAPDNTYTDLNGFTVPASTVHAGDVLSFVVTAGGSAVSVGSAANLEIVLYTNKR